MSDKSKSDQNAILTKIIKAKGNVMSSELNVLLEALGMSEDPDKHKIVTEVEFSKEIKKVIIPEGMSKKQAANDLMLQWNNEEQTQDFDTMLEGWEWKDSLRAFRNVLEDQ